MSNNTVYLSGLNGLRAIAAISVVIGHVTSFTSFDFNLSTANVGFDGVTLFFVISGFLITYLLLLEKQKTNNVEIKKFYVRRILRIWPIYYLVIAVCLVVALFHDGISDIFTTTILYYIFFAANIPMVLNTGISIIVHYWSIGVEEQFYLIWPWIVKLVRNRIIPVTVIIICVLFLVKSGSWFYLGKGSLLYKFLSVTRFHCMLIGAVGAMLFKDNNRIFIYALTNKLVQIFAWLFMVILAFNIIQLPAPLSGEITAFISLIVIVGQVVPNKRKIIELENKFLDFLGKISYGLYVIHPLVILLFSYIYKDLNLTSLAQTIVVYSSVILTTIFISYVSYEYYEKPFLKVKKQFMVVQSSNSRFMKH